MVKRLLAVLCLLVAGVLLVTLSTPDVHHEPGWASLAIAGGTAGQDCAHCHETPHGESTTADCASCHEPASWAPSIFDMTLHPWPLEGAHPGVACADCHVESQLGGLPTACSDCHVDRHRGKLGQDCTQCHTVAAFAPVPDFDHEITGFSLTGSHGNSSCSSCHEGENGRAMLLVQNATCDTCHITSHAEFKTACTDCHKVTDTDFSLTRARHDHRETGFALERRHQVLACSSCHPATETATPSQRCSSCHIDPHVGQLGIRCDDCHREDRWQLARFDHDLTDFPLRGRHFTTSCASCHTSQRWVGLTDECWDCHMLDAAQARATAKNHPFGRINCADCHSLWSFD